MLQRPKAKERLGLTTGNRSSHNCPLCPLSFPHCFLSRKEWNEGMKRGERRDKGRREGRREGEEEGEGSQAQSKHRVEVGHLET